MDENRRIAYFSMELGLSAEIPTYAGGLGVLAGDTIRAAADLGVPMVAVTLVHRAGYCRQVLDAHGNQREEPVEWVVEDSLRELPARTALKIEGRDVHLRAWQYDVTGCTGYKVPVLFLDADLPANSDDDRTLTHHLYGGDDRYRLCQEAILGIGGVRMLRALGYRELQRFHLNEGHAGFLTLELLHDRLWRGARLVPAERDVEAVREQCVFTTHTPVPAGHDQFPLDLVGRVLGSRVVDMLQSLSCADGTLNMTLLALHLSGYVNGVARRHGEVSRQLFPRYPIDSITNAVHARTWVSPPFQQLFDRYIPTWREDSFSLRNAHIIPNHQVWLAHCQAKERLIDYVNRHTDADMDTGSFTIGFARRAATYKRPALFFEDLARVKRICADAGPLQLVYAGKAHPRDQGGKDVIRQVVRAARELRETIKVVYLENYDMELCRLMTAGVDLWLNTPEPPMEASGTSGMKAAFNAVPSLSVLDGWWVEGWIEGTTGWAIGTYPKEDDPPPDRSKDAASLYDKLEHVILPLYYRDRDGYVDVMRHCIALNGSFFNTQRMMQQYVLKAYFG